MGLYWDDGKEMKTNILAYIRVIWGLYWDNGKENENYSSILGLYADNGKENGNL